MHTYMYVSMYSMDRGEIKETYIHECWQEKQLEEIRELETWM